MLIDTHAHLNFTAFEKDLSDVINQAKDEGVRKIIIPGAKIDSSKKAVEIAEKYDNCFAAVGIHPHHIDELAKLEKAVVEEELEKLIINKKVVAVGEIGMDYHEYKGYLPVSEKIKKQQKELLTIQMEIAQKYKLPVIFHCRDAHDDQLRITNDYVKSKSHQITGVFHCFGGNRKHLKEILEMGFYVGFDGNITYPENKELQELAMFTPPDRLLLETDSPYLTPIPFRNQRNIPSYLYHTATFVSRIRHISLEELAEITTQNALRLFRL